MRSVAIIVVLLLAGALTLATCGTVHASGSGLPSLPDAPDRDQQRAHGKFGVTACALVSQAAFDASMTRGWYVDAARLLRQCGRVMAARSAESKARRARKGAFD